jgi:Ca2+-binding EF-hand superfamily protein
VRTKVLGAIAALTMAFFPASPALAEVTDLEILFIKADESGDLVLDLGEVLQISIIQFRIADSDGDGRIEKEELGDLAKDAEYSDNDSNKDGALTYDEMIAEKIADFKAADTNGDGVLTIDEVKKFYEGNQ